MDQCRNSGSKAVNIDELEDYMVRKLISYRSIDKGHDPGTKLCTIFRVQKHIKQIDKLSYEPIVLSIGPYHHGNTSLIFMEKVKWDCLDYVLKLNSRQKLENYLTVLESLEQKARSCYYEDAKLESDMFLRMLLLDGCFIIVYLCGTIDLDGITPEDNATSSYSHETETNEGMLLHQKEIWEHERTQYGRARSGTVSPNVSVQGIGPSLVDSNKQSHSYEDSDRSKSDPILQWYDSHALRDLLLLENQLPFFIVKELYELFAGKDNVELLIEKVCKYVKDNVEKYTTICELDGRNDFDHLLQLCHMYFRPQRRLQQPKKVRNRWFPFLQFEYFKLSCNPQDISLDQQSYHINVHKAPKRWRRAEHYHEAGIEFRRKEHDQHNPHSLLDITFDKGEVEMPCLLIEENTACLFRNLVAFEQTCPRVGNDFTAYVALISQLASTPGDVALLARKGIIIHHMRTDDEVSTLFSNLGKNVDFDPSGAYYLKSVCQMMEEYYHNRVNRWMAWLWHNHFRNPWLVLAVVAAAIVLLCTIIQSLLALLSYLDQIKVAK